MLRPYKTYAAMTFLVYICVVAIFHFQLHKNLGLKYAAFQEASDKKLDRALQKIEVLNRRIQDLGKIPAYRFPLLPISEPMTKSEQKFIPDSMVKINPGMASEKTKSLYWQTNYDYSRPQMPRCQEHVTHSFKQIGRIFIYSAYYDNRNTSSPFIRMMALLPLRYRLPTQCEFKQNGKMIQSEINYYEMCENHARQYGGFIISCRVPPSVTEVPCSVKVVTNASLPSYNGHPKPQGDVSQVSVPVLASNHLSNITRKRFALCIPPIFGVIKPRLLVEFIELNLLLGVQHLNFYTFQVNSDIQKILDHYEKAGVVTQIHWTLPISSSKVWYHGQLLTINDCLYRHMYHFDYIGFHDIDELMVPHGPYHKWSELIDDLKKTDVNQNVAGYVFPSAFFDIANRTKAEKKPEVYFTNEVRRVTIFSQVRTKCLVRPSRIFELGIHHISRTLSSNAEVSRLKEDQGYLHHYRKCVTDFDPKMRCGRHTKDDHLSTFATELKTRRKIAMKKIFKNHMVKLLV